MALGTSTPTSTTVVETNISVAPEAKRSMTASFSAGFILPWRNLIQAEGKTSFKRLTRVLTEVASETAESSMALQIQ